MTSVGPLPAALQSTENTTLRLLQPVGRSLLPAPLHPLVRLTHYNKWELVSRPTEVSLNMSEKMGDLLRIRIIKYNNEL